MKTDDLTARLLSGIVRTDTLGRETLILDNPDGPAAARLIKSQAAEIERLRRTDAITTVIVKGLMDHIAALEADLARAREALTPSAKTKAAYMSEFQFRLPVFGPSGEEITLTPNVPWTTIKEIMAAIRKRAALEARDV